MIGTNVRGLRHLWRLSDNSIKEILVNFRDYGYCFCHVIKTKKDSPVGETLAIFNTHFDWGKRRLNNYLNSMCMSSDDARFVAEHYSRVIEFGNPMLREELPYIYDITMLPDNFEEEYSKFLSSNNKMIRTLVKKYGYETDNAFSKRAFMYTDGSKNFYQWAINAYFQTGTSMSSIRRIMGWNEMYGQMAKNLRKNTITAYTSSEDIVSLSEELLNLRLCKRINDVINMFNTAQKKILKARVAEFTEKDKETMSKFYRLSETKKINFVRKMSTIEDYDEIMRQMRHMTSIHFDWNKDSFMDFISNVENMKYETIYDNGDVVLIKVDDYETVKNLAKTTNWCISKNKTYWNNYVEHRSESTQYMVFDFSKKEDDLLSIIGFTTEYNRGITHAHDFTNNDIMKPNNSSDRQFLTSFISKFNSGNGIYDVLKNCGIDITLVAKYDKPLYEWNKETMYKYLYECVNKNNVDVLHDDGRLVAISVKDSNVKYFLGDTYIDNVSGENWACQHIIFMDFGMSEYDPNRIQFAIIRNNDGNQEDYCMALYNEHIEGVNMSFETKLSQYGLPYDIIRRADNIYVKIEGAFRSCNAPALKNLLKNVDKKVLEEAIVDYLGNESAINIISSSITECMSFDMLDVFYDNGIKLTSIFDPSLVNIIIKNVMNCMVNHGRNGVMGGEFKSPTQEDINRFFNGECNTIDEAFYIGSYLVLKKIIKVEKECKRPNNLYRRLTSIVLMNRKKAEVFEELLMDIADQLNFRDAHDTINAWVSYACVHGSDKMKEYAQKNVLIYKYPKDVWDNINNRMNNVIEPQRVQYHIHEEDLGIPVGQMEDEPELPNDDFEFMEGDDEEFIDEDGGDEVFDEDLAIAPAEAGPF